MFFLAGSSQVHSGPERVGDLLNTETGFFPFEFRGETTLINRAHVLKVSLPPRSSRRSSTPATTSRRAGTVNALLTTGETITGHVVVFRPAGHERLSDYARMDEPFGSRAPDRTLLVNSAHIVALTEVTKRERSRRHVEDADRYVGQGPATCGRRPAKIMDTAGIPRTRRAIR